MQQPVQQKVHRGRHTAFGQLAECVSVWRKYARHPFKGEPRRGHLSGGSVYKGEEVDVHPRCNSPQFTLCTQPQ